MNIKIKFNKTNNLIVITINTTTLSKTYSPYYVSGTILNASTFSTLLKFIKALYEVGHAICPFYM